MARDVPKEPAVALFSGYYPAHGGGIEIVCENLAAGFAANGYDVTWCALDDGREGPRGVARSPLPGTDIFYRLTGTPMPLPGPRALWRIWNSVAGAQAVVIAEASFVTNAVAFLAAKILGRPILLIQHLGVPSTASPFTRTLGRACERWIARPMLRSADALVYVSAAVERYFHKLVARTDALIIGHGIDTRLFAPAASPEVTARDRRELGLADDAKVACYVGRCTPSKGIQIIERMARMRPDWIFVIAGSGPVNPAGWRLPNVQTLGHVEPSRVAGIYRASDVMLLPSPSESFSLVIREAIACSTKVICGDCILDTDPGLKPYVRALPVTLDETEQTAQDFAKALDDAGDPAIDGAAYVAKHCSREAVISGYLTALDELIGRASIHKLAATA